MPRRQEWRSRLIDGSLASRPGVLFSTGRRALLPVLGLLLWVSCERPLPSSSWELNARELDSEFASLASALEIPGLAWAVIQHGEVVATSSLGELTGESPLRFASVSKALTALLVLRLVESGDLDLESSVSKLAPELNLPEDVRLRHLLTHTSEGNPGEDYVYATRRYSFLAQAIEAVTGEPFPVVLRREILDRAGMRWFDSPHLGAHAGLVSTVTEMTKLIQALDRGELISTESQKRLAQPSQSVAGRSLPLSLGWFVQDIHGTPILWSFGQDDPEHSGALLYRAPELGLTLVLLADRNVLSDPFRLLMGDVRKSPFAMIFHRLFLGSAPGEPLSAPDWSSPALAASLDAAPYPFDEELIAQAMLRLWKQDLDANRLFDLALDRGAAVKEDPVLHFCAMQLPEGRLHEEGIAAGEYLLQRHPRNRWILLAQADLYQGAGQGDRAAALFERILTLPNQEPDFLWSLFRAWSWMGLAKVHEDTDPDMARGYLERILASKIGGEMRADAEDMLESLAPKA